MMWRRESGQSSAEFALVLPFVLLLLLAALEMGGAGVRSIIAQQAASRGARVAQVFQKEYAQDEVNATLPFALFTGSATAVNDEVVVDAFSRPLFDLNALRPASALRRRAPKAAALPDFLPDAVLRDGDTPSPYCRQGGTYRVCGYPE